jgi:hypothetical protein
LYAKTIFSSSYTKKAKIILLQQGNENVGKWITEQVDIVESYRKAFGQDPTERATLGILCDSDNTKESATSYIDYIEVFQ